MKNFSIILLFFLSFNLLDAQNLENDIYNAIDVFNNKKTPEALDTLDARILIFENKLSSIDEYMAFIHLLVNKAYYLNNQNKNNIAIASYEKAWQLYKKKNIASVYEYAIIENCMKPLGVLYNQVGDYTSAENIIKNYIALAEKTNNNKQRIAGAINLSRLYQTIGRHQQAIDIANYGLSIKGANSQQNSNLKRIKASSLVLLNKTITSIDRAIVLSTNKLGSIENKQLAYELAMQKEDYPLALKIFKSLKGLKKDKLSSASLVSKLYLEEAQLYYLLNEPNTAIKKLKTAIKTLVPDYNSNSILQETTLYPENAFIGIFDLFAVLQTNPKKALKYYSLSFYVSDLLAKNTTSQDSKLILLNEKRNRSEKCLQLLYILQGTSDDSTYTIEALKLSERYKSYVLKEIVGKKELLKSHPNDSLLIQQESLIKRQEQLTNRLIKTPYNSNNKQKLDIRSELSTINIELKKLVTKIESKYPNSTGESLSIIKLNSKLKQDNATLVEYFYGKNNIYQFIISETSTEFNKIPLTEKTRHSISSFIDYFNNSSAINNDISKFTTDAFNLYKTLKLQSVKDKNNLIIIPDGFLNFIPFDALLTAKTSTINFSKMPFLVQQHTIAFESSIDLYLQPKTASKKQAVLGVFPVFKDTPAALNFSINEAENIEKEIKTTLLMERFATKDAFLKEAKKHTILHLSTHANSGDFIVPAHIEFIDETLYLNELYSIDLNSDLVILSACETGIGALQRGEGAMSIARGFQYAGAKNVLFSLWQISDLSTSKIMTSFYKQYNESKSAVIANRNSKLAYLENETIKNIKKSPYYWSAFVFYGKIDTIEVQSLSNLPIVVVSTIIILLLLTLYIIRNGKRTKRISTKKGFQKN